MVGGVRGSVVLLRRDPAEPVHGRRPGIADDLFAVGATFTLLAWAFAYVFTVVQAVAPESLTAAIVPTSPRSWMELLFLSFTTLTSTGLSDVVPVHPFARSVVMLEQVAGVLYIALVITRMVGLSFSRTGGPRRARAPEPPDAHASGRAVPPPVT
ncbi:MAG: two pore domain potassium channel family protein [Nocardioides sp.]|nr:two pore domain potassium channel family protein [Nocardioides sp.]